MLNIYVKLVDRGSIYQDTANGIVVVSDNIVELPKSERTTAAIRNGVLVEVKEEDLPEGLKPKVEETPVVDLNPEGSNPEGSNTEGVDANPEPKVDETPVVDPIKDTKEAEATKKK